MNQTFIKLAKIALVLVYLVIIAGAVVRMTGSGMGCPDWPKCFGYLIPPTQEEQLQWQEGKEFKKGQVIIWNEALRVAKDDFTTKNTYQERNWEAYTKHEYALFNPWHTWIEFINRLLGALAGLATLVLALYSINFWRSHKRLVTLSWLIVFGMGFQAWLGATVVYSVLEPVKITIHMVMALVLVALILYLIFYAGAKPRTALESRFLKNAILVSLGLTLVQIVLGTQVRQFVDERIDIVGEQAKSLWLQNPTLQFYVHRTFSIVVLLLNGYLFYYIKKHQLGFPKIKAVMLLLIMEVATGIAMYYIDFPFGSQPLHLVLASILFGIQFYLVLEVPKTTKSHKTS